MESIAHRIRRARSLALALSAVCWTSFASSAQVTEAPSSIPERVAVPAEQFEPPRVKFTPFTNKYFPSEEMSTVRDGWAMVNMMVDTKGKPHDVIIVDSSGNKVMENAIERFVSAWKFESATQNGKKIEASYTMRVNFSRSRRARAEFVAGFKSLTAAIERSDRSAADALMIELEPINTYESTFFGMVTFEYAKRWGDEAKQIEGLKQAIASEYSDRYLSKDGLEFALSSLLPLQVKTNDFSGALDTWERMQSFGVKKATIENARPLIDKVRSLQTDSRPYAVAGELVDGDWTFGLFKSRFRIEVSDGKILQIKLNCEKKMVVFPFDPSLEYQVSDSVGKCWLNAVGDAKTKFKLIQL